MAFGKPTYKKTWTKIVAKDLSPCRVRIEEVMVKKEWVEVLSCIEARHKVL